MPDLLDINTERLRSLQLATGLSSIKLSEAAGLGHNTVARALKTGRARIWTVHEMARVLGVETAELIA